MTNDLTIIYYSGNRERPEFERRIQDTIIANSGGEIPIVSCTQQPMDFGENICVGPVGHSSQNAWRQMQLAAQAAKTRFVCAAESDILYPPEYFQFRPPDDETFYLAEPLWVLFAQRGLGKVYCKKHRGSESAMMCSRDLLVRRLEQILHHLPMWGLADADGVSMPYPLDRHYARRGTYQLPVAVVTFKTDENIHRKTPHDVSSKTRDLPYWGNAKDLIARYVG